MADTEHIDDIFAGMKKKSKKSKKVNLDELDLDAPSSASAPSLDAASNAAATDLTAAPTPADAPGDDGELDFSSLKRTKKAKKSVRIDSDAEDDEAVQPRKSKKTDKLGNELDDEPQAAASEVLAVDNSVDEFADLKKKKKKSSKKAFDLEAFEKELAESESAGASAAEESAQPKSILKKAAPAGSDDEEGDEVEGDEEAPEGENPFGKGEEDEDEGTTSKAAQAAAAKAWLKEDRDYTYTELLGRFYSLLYQSHPSLSGGAGKKKYTIPPPQLFREGSKRSNFANIGEICKRMRRTPEHVIQFLFAELGTTGSVDGSGRLVIKGRYQGKQIENVLRRYIYVTCSTCKSPDTSLSKKERLFFMTCASCGSTRSVAAIKTGFKAVSRADRRAAKAAAA
ncbi:hypothetical protein JCM8097_004757 [Rhodosporidiobolus ruineniae]